MADKEIRFKLSADDKELSSALKNAERDAENLEKKSQRAAMSLGDIAKAVASAFAGAKIISFFKSATDEATKLESALTKVSSAARAYGQSADAAKSAAMSLAQDGFMSATQSAQALSNLMAVGLNVDQAKKFIQASKDITAFGNTIGDAAQATEDLTLGLLRGSALVIDNASPALKSLSREYEQILNKSGKAAAAQYAYNQILKESAKFSGDAERYMNTAAGAQQRFKAATDSASAAIGKALQPALIAITRALTSVIESFEKWFSSLTPMAQTIAVIGTGFIALLPVIASLIPVVKGLGAAFIALAANPVVLAIAGIAAGITALGIAYAQAQPKVSETQQKISEVLALKEQVKQLEAAKASANELAAAKRDLAAAENSLMQKYGDALKLMNESNASLERRLDLITNLELAEKRLGNLSEMTDEELKRRSAELEAKLKPPTATKLGKYTLSGTVAAPELASAFSDSDTSNIRVISDREKDEAELALVKRELARRKTKSGGGGVTKREPIEIRYIESLKKIEKIKNELKETEITINASVTIEPAERARRIAQARADAQAQIDAEINELRSRYAVYIENRAEAARLAREKEKEQAIRASEELFEAELKAARGNAQEIERIKKDHEERKLAIARAAIIREARDRAQAFADTAQAAEKMVSSISQMMTAKTAGAGLGAFGGFLGGLSGLSSFMPALSALGPIGTGIGAIGGIVSTFEGLFGKSDEERRQEAERAARIAEEQKKILELQASYQKQMLAIQEAQAKLPFENLQRQLRLIDIQAQQRRVAGESEAVIERDRLASRQAAIQAVLESEAGAISGGRLFGGFAPTAENLTAFLSERAAQAPAIETFMSIMRQLSNREISMEMTKTLAKQAQSLLSYLPAQMQSIFSGMLSELASVEGGYISQQQAINTASAKGALMIGLAKKTAQEQKVSTLLAIPEILSNAESLASEIRSDTAVAENMLSVIEQQLQTQLEIEQATKQTAQNTQLQLESDRAAAFIDIAGGGIRQFGGFLASTPLTLSENAQSVVLSSLTARAIEKTDVELLAEILTVSKDMRELLAEIALNTNRTAGNFGGLSETELLSMLENFRRRS